MNDIGNPRPHRPPLYRRIRDEIIQRISTGAWRPGEALPSEQALAGELGVSQGTVRKVLDGLTAEHLLERHQGKGTFVAEYTEERSLWRFFRIARPDRPYAVPQSADASIRLRASQRKDQDKLSIGSRDKVVEIARIRLLENVPVIRERIVVPASLFPGLERRRPIVNTLYSLYQTEYGIHVASVREELRPQLATKEDARALPTKPGRPLLEIDRVAYSLDGLKVEWRVSRLAMEGFVYATVLS